MDRTEILDALKQAILNYDEDRARALVTRALDADIPPLDIVDGGLSRGMKDIGEKFQAMEVFLPELMLAAKVFLSSMELIEPAVLRAGEGKPRRGVAVIGTVKGDVHSIGKALYATLLKVAGFEVHNLGVNVHPGRFVEKAEETEAQIVGISALMTTTMPAMREVVESFAARGLRGRHAILIGGSPVTQAFCEKIQADGYGETAQDGVDLAIRFAEKGGRPC